MIPGGKWFDLLPNPLNFKFFKEIIEISVKNWIGSGYWDFKGSKFTHHQPNSSSY